MSTDESETRDDRAVQDAWPELTCYGCGPANPAGLRLWSHVGEDGTALVATVEPGPEFNVAPGVMYGGYIASVIDCNSIWTAMTFASPPDARPPHHAPEAKYVTGELVVRYLEPTPLDRPVHVRSWVDGDIGRKTVVRSELRPEGEITATGKVTAVRIARWDSMASLGTGREVHWLSGDEAAEGRTQGIRLDWTTYDADGAATTEPLAAYEQHGKWVEWFRSGE